MKKLKKSISFVISCLFVLQILALPVMANETVVSQELSVSEMQMTVGGVGHGEVRILYPTVVSDQDALGNYMAIPSAGKYAIDFITGHGGNWYKIEIIDASDNDTVLRTDTGTLSASNPDTTRISNDISGLITTPDNVYRIAATLFLGELNDETMPIGMASVQFYIPPAE